MKPKRVAKGRLGTKEYEGVWHGTYVQKVGGLESTTKQVLGGGDEREGSKVTGRELCTGRTDGCGRLGSWARPIEVVRQDRMVPRLGTGRRGRRSAATEGSRSGRQTM